MGTLAGAPDKFGLDFNSLPGRAMINQINLFCKGLLMSNSHLCSKILINLFFLLVGTTASCMDQALLKKTSKIEHKPSRMGAAKRAGSSPLHKAAQAGDLQKVKLLKSEELNVTDKCGITPLHDASYCGHRKVVIFLVNSGAVIDVEDMYGMTPLLCAIEKGHSTIVTFLVRRGAQCTRIGRFTVTPYCFASETGQTTIEEILREKGADTTLEESFGQTPLHKAAFFGDKMKVAELIAADVDIEAKNKDNCTPLFLAAIWGHKAVVVCLIEEGAEINTRDVDGRLCLHYAAMAGNIKVVEELIDSGATVTVTDNDGKTPLDCAADMEHDAIVELLLTNGAYPDAKNTFMAGRMALERRTNISSLHCAALRGDVEQVKQEISARFSTILRDRDDITPLHDAAYAGHSAVVELLVNANKALLNYYDRYGMTPLHCAIEKGHAAIVIFLVQKGADVNALAHERHNVSPLDYAQHFGHKKIADFLITSGAKRAVELKRGVEQYHVDAIFGNTEPCKDLLENVSSLALYCEYIKADPLILAAFWGHDELVKILIDFWERMHESMPLATPLTEGITMYKNRALIAAASNGHIAIAKTLVSHGAALNNVDLEEYHEHTSPALAQAIQGGHKEMVEFLLSIGASIDRYSLNWAAYYGYVELVELLLSKGVQVHDYLFESAIKNGHVEVIKALMNHGASIPATSLCTAVTEGQKEVVEFLLAHGVDVNDKTRSRAAAFDDSNSTLHCAVEANRKEIAEILVNCGVDLTIDDSVKALLKAIKKGSQDIAMLLVLRGVDVNRTAIDIRNRYPHSAFHLACLNGNKELVEVMLKQGADIESKDRRGNTAIKLASNLGMTEIVKLLTSIKKTGK